jgi:uncharacterized BrkB/YihY/UPF0761 family membrane protein
MSGTLAALRKSRYKFSLRLKYIASKLKYYSTYFSFPPFLSFSVWVWAWVLGERDEDSTTFSNTFKKVLNFEEKMV